MQLENIVKEQEENKDVEARVAKKKLVKRGSTIIWILDAYDSEHDKLFVGLVLQNDSHWDWAVTKF